MADTKQLDVFFELEELRARVTELETQLFQYTGSYCQNCGYQDECTCDDPDLKEIDAREVVESPDYENGNKVYDRETGDKGIVVGSPIWNWNEHQYLYYVRWDSDREDSEMWDAELEFNPEDYY